MSNTLSAYKARGAAKTIPDVNTSSAYVRAIRIPD